MILTYDAVNDQGKHLTNTVEASDVTEAVEQLRGKGLYVTRITERGRPKAGATAAAPSADAHRKTASVRLGLGPLALLTRQMAMLLRAGSDLVSGFMAIGRQIKRPQNAALLARITADLEEGATLTDALRKHPRSFDAVYCAIIAAGEASGALPAMFERLAEMIGQRRRMRNTIIAASIYPALLIVMCFGILCGLLLFVLPRFHDMFTQLGVETPGPTRIMLAAGELVREYWYVGLVGVVSCAALIAWLLVQPLGRRWIANVQTAIPILGRLRSRLIQGQILRTMGTLLESRVGLLEALDLVRESTTNTRFQKLFHGMEDAVTSGGKVSTAFEECGMIEPYICQAVRTGEDSSNVGEAMNYCADILDETNAELVKVVSKLIEPLILIGMGVLVGGVAISLFLPLFDLTSAMN